MMYAVIEMQKTGDTMALLTNTYPERNLAESAWHMVMSAAAISSVPVHSAIIVNELGEIVSPPGSYYRHNPQVNEETESA